MTIEGSRRAFLAALGGAAAFGSRSTPLRAQEPPRPTRPRIRVAAIGLNHSHLNGQIAAVTRGGGELVSFFGKEADLAAAFGARYPSAKLARSEQEILEDPFIQLVVSAAIPNERAPLGIQVMRHGKDFMVDKPGTTTLEQLAEVQRVQSETKRIYSVLIERHEHRGTTKAAELVKSGAIGQGIQTVSLGPHRMNPGRRPAWFFRRELPGGALRHITWPQACRFLLRSIAIAPDVVRARLRRGDCRQHVRPAGRRRAIDQPSSARRRRA